MPEEMDDLVKRMNKCSSMLRDLLENKAVKLRAKNEAKVKYDNLRLEVQLLGLHQKSLELEIKEAQEPLNVIKKKLTLGG